MQMSLRLAASSRRVSTLLAFAVSAWSTGNANPAWAQPAPAASRALSEIDATRGARAIALARLDAAIHYFDPVAAATATPWDSLFAAHAPAALSATSVRAYRAELAAMLRGRGDALTALEPTEAVVWQLRMRDGVGVIAQESGKSDGKPDRAQTTPLVIDLRGGARLRDDALARYIGVAPTPAQHALWYHGLPPATMQTSGGYGIEWKEAQAASADADRTRAARRIVVLADRASVLPASLLDGIAAGRVSVISTGAPFVAIDGVTHAIDMGEGVRVQVRRSKSSRFGVAIAADSVVDDKDAYRVAVAAAGSLARATTLAVRDSASLRPVMPGLQTVRVPANTALAFTSIYPDVGYRLLAAVRTWSTYDVFSPYKHRFTKPWSGVLASAIPRVLQARNEFEFGVAVAYIVRETNDSHSSFSSPGINRAIGGGMSAPLTVQFLDERLVITRLAQSIRDTTSVRRGDEILRINGLTVDSLVRLHTPLIAASTPQALRYTLEQRVMGGMPGALVTLRLRDPAGAERDVSLRRAASFDRNASMRRGGGIIRMLPDNIGYVDMERLPPNLVDSVFRALGRANAIIFDMRGYPQGTGFQIGPRLSRVNTPVTVAHFDRPERPSPDSSTFTVFPFDQTFPVSNASHFTGRTAMLLDEHAVSQSEHTALIFRAHSGTTFVGSPTVGANGDVTDLVMPGGLRFYMTGQSVKWPDGAVLQGKGVIPDVAVRPTVTGLRDDIDEVLTAAFNHVGGKGTIKFEESAATEGPLPFPVRAVANEPAVPSWYAANLTMYRVGIDTTIDGPVAGAPRGSLHLTYRGGDAPRAVSASQMINADAWRGKRVTLSGWVRARGVPMDGLNGIGLWMRVDREDGEMILDNMSTRTVRGTSGWQRVSITLDVPTNTMGISVGALFYGEGEGWVDDLELAEAGPSAAVSASSASARMPQAGLTEMRASYPKSSGTLRNPSFRVDGGR